MTLADRWLAAAALALLAASASAAASVPPPDRVAETLPNGLRVSIVSDFRMPIVATQVWYRIGSANEEPGTRGFAHLFEHLMFGGTPSHPRRAVWDHHERFGGEVNAYTSFDETVYVSEVTPAGHEGVIELEADRMVNLSLTEENLENEKRIVAEELRFGTENDPIGRLFTVALQRLLGEHPYAVTPVGTREDVAAATLDHAREFYRRHYRPGNAHLVVVGPVDAPTTLDRVRAAFGPLPADGETPPDVPEILGWTYPDLVELREDLPPVEVALTLFPLPAPAREDRATIEVLQEILARSATDPFEDELVRRRGRALLAGTETLTARRGGLIAFYAASLPYRRRGTAFRHLEEGRQALGRFAELLFAPPPALLLDPCLLFQDPAPFLFHPALHIARLRHRVASRHPLPCVEDGKARHGKWRGGGQARDDLPRHGDPDVGGLAVDASRDAYNLSLRVHNGAPARARGDRRRDLDQPLAAGHRANRGNETVGDGLRQLRVVGSPDDHDLVAHLRKGWGHLEGPDAVNGQDSGQDDDIVLRVGGGDSPDVHRRAAFRLDLE